MPSHFQLGQLQSVCNRVKNKEFICNKSPENTDKKLQKRKNILSFHLILGMVLVFLEVVLVFFSPPSAFLKRERETWRPV